MKPVDPIEQCYESAACGLLTLAVDGTIRRVNATFCQMVGWQASDLAGKVRFQELLTVGSKVFHQTHWMPLLQLQGSAAEVQLDLQHRDRRTLSALVNASLHAAPHAEGSERSVHVAVFIATDRRKYERELLLARRRAEELLASERTAQQARALAEERLRLALDSAKLHTWHVDVDLHALVADCVEEVRLSWPGRMIEVCAAGSGAGQLDADRLAQVVVNLANNALTYGSPERPLTITSRVNDEHLEVHVHNHGQPIARELLAHIFEPLRRGEHSMKLGSRSIGLGLYIVRQIAVAHGGAVTVTSTEAEGTTFVVQLPRRA